MKSIPFIIVKVIKEPWLTPWNELEVIIWNYIWKYAELYGNMLNYMEICWIIWKYAELYGNILNYMEIYWITWKYAELYGNILNYMEIYWIIWNIPWVINDQCPPASKTWPKSQLEETWDPFQTLHRQCDDLQGRQVAPRNYREIMGICHNNW